METLNTSEQRKSMAWQWMATALIVCAIAFIATGTFVRFSAGN